MNLPLPVLAVIGIVFLILVVLVLRRGGGPRDLIAPPRSATPPPPPRAEPPRARPAGAAPLGELAAELDAEVRALLAAGQKIQAIKLVREATGLGLAEAKDLVERM